MAGKSKYAERMAAHIGATVDAAAPIARTGGTAAQLGGAVGGALGAVIGGRASARESDVPIGQYAWLGVGPESLAITGASAMGRPKGDPVRIAYADVTAAAVTEGKLTLRVDLDLVDGRHVAFEAKRTGVEKSNVEVIELLRTRLPVG